MSATGLVRAQYWNVSGPNPTPRSGMTSRAESRTDVEGYLLAADAVQNAVTYTYGVAGGLQVSATTGETAVTVATGVALDVGGQIVVLAEGGLAIVDPFVGPTGVQNIPTVQVEASGVTFDTTGLAGDLLFTITWREVEEATSGLLVLHQAPWLRLVDPATFVDDGLQLVLAVVTLGTGGVVDALAPGARRYVGIPASRLELRSPYLDAAGPAVGQRPVAELIGRTDGGVDLNVLPPTGPPGRALSVLGAGGDVDVAAGLRVGGPAVLAASLAVAAGVETSGDLSVAGNMTAGGDLAIAGNATAGRDLSVSGGADVGSSLAVHGSETIGIDLVVARNVVVGGRVGVRKSNPAFELDVAGTICANTFCNPSDLRVKSDVREVADVLDRLADVRAVTFLPARTDPGTPVRRHAGVVAQDVVKSLPELVIPMGPDGVLAVDYAGLAGVLVGAVNELRAATATLSERVAELEDRRGRVDDVRG
jgi:hypothetical protein